MKFKKLTLLILALLTVFALFAACSEPTEKEAVTETTTAAPETNESGETVETEKLYANDIAAEDFGGYVFHMVNNGLSTSYYSALDFTEMTGETMNDAIYERNRRIESKFNIKIECNNDGAADQLRACVISGTLDVDIGYVLMNEVMGLISGGYLLPINALGNIDMSLPYWDQGAIETVQIDGNIFHGYLDISFDHYESMSTLFYNGEMLNDYGLDDPFNLYYDGKWTMDAMYKMMQTVSADLNGDGKLKTTDDQLGFVGREFEYLPMLHSSNQPLLEFVKDGENSTFSMRLGSESLIEIGTMINKMLCDKSIAITGGTDEANQMFKEGRVLFYSHLLGNFRTLRDKEDDYGIISYPAYQENAEDPRVYVQNPMAIIIPKNAEDTDRTGVILQALAADTYDNVMGVYFEKAVIGKGVRDENSAAMLWDMRSRRSFEVSYAYGLREKAVGAYYSAVQSTNFASMADRYQKAFDKIAKQNVAAFFDALDY